MEYNEIEYFIKEYARIKENQNVKKQLELSNVIRTALVGVRDKKGQQTFTKWRRDLLDTIKDKKEELESIFDKRKRERKVKKNLTVFEKRKIERGK